MTTAHGRSRDVGAAAREPVSPLPRAMPASRVAIPIGAELAARLERHATARGVDVDDLAEQALATLPTPAGWARRSPAEERVARLLALGAMTREIADTFGVSIKTIDTHRGRVLRKLGLRTTVALVRYAIRHGHVEAAESVYEAGVPAGAPGAVRRRISEAHLAVGRRDRLGTLTGVRSP